MKTKYRIVLTEFYNGDIRYSVESSFLWVFWYTYCDKYGIRYFDNMLDAEKYAVKLKGFSIKNSYVSHVLP